MRVGLLAYLLHSGRDYRSAGVATYASGLAGALAGHLGPKRLLVYQGADAVPIDGSTARRFPLSTSNPLLRIAVEQMVVPVLGVVDRPDVLHGTVNVVPLLSRTPRVVTVHDLAFLRHPERFRRERVAYLTAAVGRSAHASNIVICVSENTRQDVLELLRVPEHRTVVVHPGVNPGCTPLPPDAIANFRECEVGNRPYLLHVGTLEPRKNIDVLIRAFAAVKASGAPHALALVGARGWMYESLFSMVRELGLEDDVRFVDYVDPARLPLWYNAADIFAYPSAYEGFGLPVVEAMACGVPVVTSAASSLAEVAGDACLTVEPGSEKELEMALLRILGDASLRERLRASGLRRSALFSWTRAAQETIRLYERALGE